MKYKFYNEEISVLVDALEWLSLIEAAKEMGTVLEGDYTPPWRMDAYRKYPSISYPIQTIFETKKLSNALSQIYDLITENAPNSYVPPFVYHTLTHIERIGLYGKELHLGCLHGVYYGDSNYLPLDHFTGKKVRVIEDLLKLCATPRFEIDWTPLMDEESDNEEA